MAKKTIDFMVEDFLRAWLVDSDVPAARWAISRRAFAAGADADQRSAFDRGLAPFQVLQNLKAAHEALAPHLARGTCPPASGSTIPTPGREDSRVTPSS